MSMHIDDRTEAIEIKVMIHGPALAGKTTCLQYIDQNTPPQARAGIHRVTTKSERYVACSILRPSPLDARQLRVQLIACPGAVFYEESQRRILQDADAVMFVADSQQERSDANIEALERTDDWLGARPVSMVLIYNKRDLPNTLSLAALAAQLNPRGRHPSVATIATRGTGVYEALDALLRSTIPTLPP